MFQLYCTTEGVSWYHGFYATYDEADTGGGGRSGPGRPGGGGGGGGYLYPLIAEVGVGAGRVMGIAFDLNDLAGMQNRELFVQNTLTYLLAASRR